jgi:hypothetical protein
MSTPPSPKSTEQIQYEHLTSYAKWALVFTGTIILAITSVAIYFSYRDKEAMQEEYSKTLADLKLQIVDLKNDSKERTKTLQDDAKDAVKSYQDFSEREISRIKISTNDVALKEANRQIQEIYSTDRMQNLIEHEAVKEIKGKVSEIVDDQTRNLYKIFDAANKMRDGFPEGAKVLESFFSEGGNTGDSARARKLYDDIALKYENVSITYANNGVFKDVMDDNTKMPTDKKQIEELSTFINALHDPTNDLTSIAIAISCISTMSKIHFKCFEIERIDAWYKGLKK